MRLSSKLNILQSRVKKMWTHTETKTICRSPYRESAWKYEATMEFYFESCSWNSTPIELNYIVSNDHKDYKHETKYITKLLLWNIQLLWFFVVVLLIVSIKIVVLMSVNSCISDTNPRKYSSVVLMHVHMGKSTT